MLRGRRVGPPCIVTGSCTSATAINRPLNVLNVKAFKTTCLPQGSLEGRAATSGLWCDGTGISESLSGRPSVARAPASHRFYGPACANSWVLAPTQESARRGGDSVPRWESCQDLQEGEGLQRPHPSPSPQLSCIWLVTLHRCHGCLQRLPLCTSPTTAPASPILPPERTWRAEVRCK
ncbi:Golgi apparatus membrane protein TVP23 homolog A isoform X4 [Psammomys obesus]|uniref:Golgi apparatus membrane protein TVP23 homolog A isoform X4 n=1 Tax=Psammomys obesus TaxID=48139 RepID=UPI0024533EE7|nr:Golgi apparatus membrane protein TVP23 homolog A isoform X4 [Psammomys obesus]